MPKLVLLAFLLAACDVGSVEGGGGAAGQPDAASNGNGNGNGGSGSDSGVGTSSAAPLTVTLTTSPTPTAVYAPNHVLAVWIQDAQGTFVKTIGRHAQTRKSSLVGWIAKAGALDADAVSGATINSHTNAVTVTWDLKDRQGAIVPDGTYTIRMETADKNAVAPTENNQGTFTFVKGAQPQKQTALSNGGFSNVTIDFAP